MHHTQTFIYKYTSLAALVQLRYPEEDEKNISITGGGLVGKYVLKEFHFHWGETDDRGSEHTVNGQSFGAEVC